MTPPAEGPAEATGDTENPLLLEEIRKCLDAFTEATRAFIEVVRNGAPPRLLTPEESENDGRGGGDGIWSSKVTEEQDR